MPVLSNGNTLTIITAPEDYPFPDAGYLYQVTNPEGELVNDGVGVSGYMFGWVELASVDIFDGFFTITGLTHDGKYEIFTEIETRIFDNSGNYLGAAQDLAAFGSVSAVAVSGLSPGDLTVSWLGANEYFNGENTQYGHHEVTLSGGAAQPFVFDNHLPQLSAANFTINKGESLTGIAFAGTDADYDLLTYIIVDEPDHGYLGQVSQFDASMYPFTGGEYFGPHYHQTFLYGNLFDYTPQEGFTGTDTFTVYATDGQGNSNTVTYSITVKAPTPPVSNYIALGKGDDNVDYHTLDHAVQVAAGAGKDRVVGTAFNDSINGGDGNDSLGGGGGKDIITGGKGADRMSGGNGNDTFIFRAGDLQRAGAAVDHIIDFHGAGSTSTATEQDILQLRGFGAGTTLVFDHYGSSQALQYYRIVDTVNPANSGAVLIQMADSTSHLTAADYAFYAS